MAERACDGRGVEVECRRRGSRRGLGRRACAGERRPEYGRTGIRLPSDSGAVGAVPLRFAAQYARTRLDVAASPRLNTTLFAQWDNESERVALNARVRWTTSPGSDAYLAWNSAWPSDLPGGFAGVPWRRPAGGALVAKFVRYMRL
ncbi:MAG: hypothetical protein ACXW61_14635 [Gemmatirosa sp.]